MSDYCIREIFQEDIDLVVDLWRKGDLLRPWTSPIHDITVAVMKENSTVFVVEYKDRIIATAAVGHDGHHGWAYYVAIDPVMRNRGFGKLIMDHVELWLKERGVSNLSVAVREDNERGLSFYENLGYTNLGVQCFQKDLNTQACNADTAK